MVDHYQVLGIEPGATRGEVQAAFDELLAVRKARRQKTSDLHVALAVLADSTLRHAYDLVRFGAATGDRISLTKEAAVDFAAQVISEVDLQEVAESAKQATLRVVVLVSGVTAKFADLTAVASRRIQVEAAKRITA